MLIAHLVVDIIQRRNFAFANPVTLHQGQDDWNEHEHICHTYIYRHAKCECHSLNTVKISIIVQFKHLLSLRCSCDLERRTRSSDWENITFISTIFTANLRDIAWTVSKIIEHLFSRLRSVWPWMKVKVNINNTSCILISEAVTMPSLTMITSTVSEESLARDTHRHRLFALSILNFF